MSYKTLQANVGYLKNVDLETEASDGITQADLTLAETSAQALIDATLAPVYDLSDWASSTPPVIADVAELLSSASVLDFKYARDASAEGSDGYAAQLRARGLDVLREVRQGRVAVVGTDGVRRMMRSAAGATVPQANVPQTEFFPDSTLAKTFDEGTLS